MGKPQISVDGWRSWPDAFRAAFGWAGVDLGVIIKEYENDSTPTDPARKYSPGRVKSSKKFRALGAPAEEAIDLARGAPEPHHADAHAPVDPLDERL